MLVKRFWLFLVFVNLPLALLTANSADRNTITMDIETRIRTESVTNIFLDITLKNDSSNVLRIPNGYLPWDGYAMTIALVEAAPTSTPLKQELIISDPLPGKPWRLKKGTTLHGQINLTSRFPDLTRVLKRTDVVVFWSYQPETEDKQKVDRVGGWLQIPRQMRQSSRR